MAAAAIPPSYVRPHVPVVVAPAFMAAEVRSPSKLVIRGQGALAPI
jgi:hypothetical protein